MKRVFGIFALCLCVALCGCAAQQPVTAQSFALDTFISVRILRGGDAQDAEAALRRVDECEALLSAHRAGSDVSRVNASLGEEVEVDALTAQVLDSALGIAEASGGALDVTLMEVSRLWDYKRETPVLPAQTDIEAALAVSGGNAVSVKGNLARAQAQLDLGAVAKGAIGDEAAQVLRERGVKSALLNLGGNILTVGDKPDGSPWRVSIEDPGGGAAVGTLSFHGSASVATSSGAQRFIEVDGQRYHHILDPKTGWPTDSGLTSVTVLAPDGLTADALSTAIFVMGEDAAADMLEARYPQVTAVMLRKDGSLRVIGEAEFTEN